jgi:poly(3-hydroxybutyrate) depolymerase
MVDWKYGLVIDQYRVGRSNMGTPNLPGDLEPQAILTDAGLRLAHSLDAPKSNGMQKQAGVFLGFHGGGGAAPLFATRSGLAMALHALGQGSIFPQANGHWSDGRLSLEDGWAADLDFIHHLVRNSGPMPLALAGLSNGAMFAQRLACELLPAPRALAMVMGAMPVEFLHEAPAGNPVHVMIAPSPVDAIIPWSGGEMMRIDTETPGGELLSADDTLAFWLRRNRAVGVAPRRIVRYFGLRPVEIRLWSGAADVWQVVLHETAHGWPERPSNIPLAGSLEDLIARFLCHYTV